MPKQTDMEESSKWYVLYTRPRFEKKVHIGLEQRGFTSYCPLNRVRKKWSDRIKIVEEPLFKSYVFVLLDEGQKTQVRMVPGVVNFVYWNGQPAEVRRKEIDDIRRFLNEYTDVTVIPHSFEVNTKVVIKSGLMMEREAVVKRILNKHVEVVVESLGYKLVAYIEKNNLIPKK